MYVMSSGAARNMPSLSVAICFCRSPHLRSWVLPMLPSSQRMAWRFSATSLPVSLSNAAFLPLSSTTSAPRLYIWAVKCQPPVLPALYSPKPATPSPRPAIFLAAVRTSSQVRGGVSGSSPACSKSLRLISRPIV
ncbi:hypothetical protein STENM223S_00905 [Streptomyces tendae]